MGMVSGNKHNTDLLRPVEHLLNGSELRGDASENRMS
jgi:hypothetical protein